MFEIVYELFFDYTLRNIALGSAVIGIVSGMLGSFALLKKQSLLGDAISHAALPGIIIAFMLTLSKKPIALWSGAVISGWIGAIIVMSVTKKSIIKEDSALGVVLSSFFGFGIFLLTIVQRMPTSKKSGLNVFLFGNASTLLQSDVFAMILFGGLSLLLCLILWKEFKIATFDREFGQSMGFGSGVIDVIMTSLIVVAIVIGLQTVGVVLMSAFLIAPGAAARQWTKSLSSMVLLSMSFGAASGIIGAVISSTVDKLPTGPTIVIIMSLIVIASLLFSPRGIAVEKARLWNTKRKIDLRKTLVSIYLLSKNHKDVEYSHSLASIAGLGVVSAKKSLEELKKLGLIEMNTAGSWHLTEGGWDEGERLLEKLGVLNNV